MTLGLRFLGSRVCRNTSFSVRASRLGHRPDPNSSIIVTMPGNPIGQTKREMGWLGALFVNRSGRDKMNKLCRECNVTAQRRENASWSAYLKASNTGSAAWVNGQEAASARQVHDRRNARSQLLHVLRPARLRLTLVTRAV